MSASLEFTWFVTDCSQLERTFSWVENVSLLSKQNGYFIMRNTFLCSYPPILTLLHFESAHKFTVLVMLQCTFPDHSEYGKFTTLFFLFLKYRHIFEDLHFEVDALFAFLSSSEVTFSIIGSLFVIIVMVNFSSSLFSTLSLFTRPWSSFWNVTPPSACLVGGGEGLVPLDRLWLAPMFLCWPLCLVRPQQERRSWRLYMRMEARTLVSRAPSSILASLTPGCRWHCPRASDLTNTYTDSTQMSYITSCYATHVTAGGGVIILFVNNIVSSLRNASPHLTP